MRYSSMKSTKKALRSEAFLMAPQSRAKLEMDFRESFLALEAALRRRLAASPGLSRDRRTLGQLIIEAEKGNLLNPVQVAEAWFVNAARNSLSHSGLGRRKSD